MRKYGKDDHESVCRLFYTTVMESWLPAYRRVVTFKAPIATIVQVVYLKMNHHYCNSRQLINIYYYQGAALALLHYLTPSFIWFLLAVFFLQIFVTVTIFYVHWGYCW